MKRLGDIKNTSYVLFIDDSFTEYFLEKNGQLKAITLEQLRMIYKQQGISWDDVQLGYDIEEVLFPGSVTAPVSTYQTPVTNQSYDDYEDSIWDSDNIKIGRYSYKGKELEVGYQNSTK